MAMRKTFVLLALAVAASRSVDAQVGLMVVAHGGGPEWNDVVKRAAGRVAWTAGPVATAFLMGPEAQSGGWGAAVDRLVSQGAREIVVVPLMVQSAGSHFRQIEYYAGLRASLPEELAAHHHADRPAVRVPMRLTPALDTAPELRQALLEHWRGLVAADRNRPVLLVAHGPQSDREAAIWVSALSRGAKAIAEEGGVNASVGLLRDDAPPEVRAAAVRRCVTR